MSGVRFLAMANNQAGEFSGGPAQPREVGDATWYPPWPGKAPEGEGAYVLSAGEKAIQERKDADLESGRSSS
jgi:hypothetical protein